MEFLGDKERSKRWHAELSGLISTFPDLSVSPLPSDALKWYGRTFSLLIEMGQTVCAVEFKSGFDYRSGSQLSSPEMEREKMHKALFTALGFAERLAPVGAIGTFIPVNSPHDALRSLAPLLGEASKDVLVVDPYMSQVFINDFALSAPEGVTLRLLSGDKRSEPNLEPAFRAWRDQRKERPMEVRLARQKLLHDRLIIPDGRAWQLSQSFNMLAKRSPATLQQLDEATGLQKTDYYEEVWKDAQQLG
jgi:hypothetical protein